MDVAALPSSASTEISKPLLLIESSQTELAEELVSKCNAEVRCRSCSLTPPPSLSLSLSLIVRGGVQVFLWWVKDVWFFNPLLDPMIRPLFGSSGVRCHVCESSVSLMGQSKKGPRRVLG